MNLPFFAYLYIETVFILEERKMSLSFYNVDKDYIYYLQYMETKKRGFTHVPNMEYENKEQKFICGIVLEINGMKYYVPVSSYKKQQKDNILINIIRDAKNPVKGSLRFNYMFPAPDECITELIISKEEVKRRNLLNKELRFVLENEERIRNKAKQTYSKVKNQVNDNIVKNSCDFKLLEKACKNYSKKLRSKNI